MCRYCGFKVQSHKRNGGIERLADEIVDFAFYNKYITTSFIGIFIVGAKRTAFGTFGGAFKNTSATQLQTAAAKAALQSAGVKPEQVDSVNFGQVIVVGIKLNMYHSEAKFSFLIEFIIRWSFSSSTCAAALWNSH